MQVISADGHIDIPYLAEDIFRQAAPRELVDRVPHMEKPGFWTCKGKQMFRSQIGKGGTFTITDPEVTRFFMTIPEACQLVLEAGAIGQGGEIFIFDMGRSVKILDLAKKMIQLSGLILGKDIQIKFIGLRPGEKLYEELLNVEENTMPTHHPLILTAKVRTFRLSEVKSDIDELTAMVTIRSNFDIIRKMKQIVPEYISQNSIYEQLD